MKTTSVLTVLFLGLAICLATGCGREKMAPSLFETETPMWRDRHHGGVYENYAPIAGRSYTRFLIEPIVFMPADEPRDAQMADRVADQFHREIVARLAVDFDIVEHPGAHVLRLQPAIIYSKIGPRFDLSKAHMEALITDSVTGEFILALADTRPHYQTTGGSLFSDWENTRDVLQAWATIVRQKAAPLKGQ